MEAGIDLIAGCRLLYCYQSEQSKLIDLDRVNLDLHPGKSSKVQEPEADTVYFSVVDGEGNGCSFINSNFMGFGTGIVPAGCGYSLQNRGRGFCLEPNHPNCLEPSKRPDHTIIPGLITRHSDDRLCAVFGVMGGMMQPQGHLQVVVALLTGELDPQAALDRGRFRVEGMGEGGKVSLEDSITPEIMGELERRGHEVRIITGSERGQFGVGQIIQLDEAGVCWAGSDPRGDGCALGVS